MKRFKKIVLTLMTMFVTLAMNFLGLANSVYATELGGNIQLQNEGDCGALLKYEGSQVITAYVTYNSSNGKTYPAYCLNKYLNGVGKVEAYAVSANNYVTDVGLWRTIINGYPYKTIKELGCANKYEAFTATKQAIYCYIHGNDVNSYEGIGEAGERTLNALKTIVANAQNSSETKLETSINVDKTISNWEQDKINKEYVSKTYSVKANANFNKYYIKLEKTGEKELPKGIKIVDLNNKEKSEFAKGDKFKILIPISALTSSLQDYALTAFEYENSEGKIEDNYYKNDTKIIIHKQDKNTQKPLEGVYFNLLNNKKETIKTGLKTDKNGQIEVKNLMPGKYYLVETSALEGYAKFDKEIEIEVSLNEKFDVIVNNTKEVKKEVEKTKEEITVTKEVEVKQVVKKLPKTGM